MPTTRTGRRPTSTSPRLAAATEAFLYACDARGYSRNTRVIYELGLRRFREVVGDLTVAELTPEHVLQFQVACRAQGCAAKTVRTYYGAVRSFVTWAHSSGLITSDPCATLLPPKLPSRVPRGFTGEEVQRLLAWPDVRTLLGARDRALMLVLLSTGLRVGELVQLRREDVLQRGSTRLLHVVGKGDKERAIPLLPEVREALALYLLRRGEDECPALWLSLTTGSGLRTVGVRSMLRSASAATGVERVHPHRFRNTALSAMLDAGMSVHDVMAISGHSTEAMLRHYVSYSQARRASDALLAADPLRRFGVNQARKRANAVDG